MEEVNQSFEDQWNAAFEGAEMSPSEHVWISIDGVLANQQAGTFKKRILFFKWVAAASVVVMVAAISALWFQNIEKDNLALESTNTSSIPESTTENSESLALINPSNSKNETGLNYEKIESNENSSLISNDINKPDLKVNKLLITQKNEGKIQNKNDDQNDLIYLANTEAKNNNREYFANTLSNLNAKQINALQTEVLPLSNELFGVADPYFIDNKKEKYDFNLWAGLSVSAGTFDPNTDNNSSTESLFLAVDRSESEISQVSFDQISNESLSSGSSISAGFDLRGQVSSKIILSSGIRYLKNSTSLNSNVALTDNSTGEIFALTSDNIGGNTFMNSFNSDGFTASSITSSFNNEFQYVSIPIKAGYIILDKKFNIVLNSGLSSNFLLQANRQNTDGQTQLLNGSESFGNNFSSVYFNFLSSVEFGYTIQDKYFLSIEPSYSQALTEFTKSNNNFSGKPRNLGLSVGLKYNF